MVLTMHARRHAAGSWPEGARSARYGFKQGGRYPGFRATPAAAGGRRLRQGFAPRAAHQERSHGPPLAAQNTPDKTRVSPSLSSGAASSYCRLTLFAVLMTRVR